MKICKYCRTEYDDEFTVCPNCGATKVFTDQELEEEEEAKRQEIEYREKANAEQDSYKKRWGGLIAVCVLCLLAVVIAVTYNVNKPLSNGMTKDEGKEILAKGTEYLEAGNYEEAIECLQQLPSDSKQYEEAQKLIQQSQDSYCDEIISRADSYIASQNFDAAYELIGQAQSLLPDNAELQEDQKRVYESYRSAVIAQTEEYVAAEQYETAIEYLKNKQESFQNDSVFQETYNNTVTTYNNLISSQAMQEAEAYVASNDYANGINVLRTALAKIGQNDELSATLSVYENTYKENVLGQVDAVYSQSGYDAVVAFLKEAMDILPTDNAVANEYELWKSRQPMLLTDLEPFSKDLNANINSSLHEVDNYGSVYASNLGLEGWSSIEYYIGSDYSKLTCTLYITENAKGYDEEAYAGSWSNLTISIYGDDVLLYTKTGFNTKDKPLDISVDVKDVEFLKIVSSNNGFIYWYGVAVGIGNPTLGW